ncbi:hypothetical protein OSB04_009639 [Centaurea solstitialis]|uniref:Protein ALP1-like n=1 Tax=Centaurea solstitialis TaxID=347529 RepID=A0AA38THU3_9ASTR|nr:hypothetical protein OSB04_009639 [Centaurea solstitialis]
MDQWIWHAFFGVPGATNDIIVVNQSPIFNDLFENKAPDSSFVVNNTHYPHGYYLADGIYPEWTTFVKAFRYPVEEPRVHFKTRQESARKDIERTFATLKDKWHVVKYPARVWTQRKLSLIMHTCIILHNMIREDEGFSHYPFDPTEVLPGEIETTISEEDRARNVNLVKNSERHANLRHDLSIHGMRGMIVDERYGVGRVVGKLMWQLMWQQLRLNGVGTPLSGVAGCAVNTGPLVVGMKQTNPASDSNDIVSIYLKALFMKKILRSLVGSKSTSISFLAYPPSCSSRSA